jgi:protein-S-isoprenylcysteine O-methyltransferase Ste14
MNTSNTQESEDSAWSYLATLATAIAALFISVVLFLGFFSAALTANTIHQLSIAIGLLGCYLLSSSVGILFGYLALQCRPQAKSSVPEKSGACSP